MQTYSKMIGALVTASALASGTAMAEVEYEIQGGYTSAYLFRGLNRGQDLIGLGADAATEWNGLGLSAGAWHGSFQNSAVTADDNLTELQVYGEVSKAIGAVTTSVGYISYQNSNGVGAFQDDRQEVYFSAARCLGFARASLTYYWDVEEDNDGYSELALQRSFEINQCLNLNVSSNVGYLVEQGQATAWTTKVGLDWAFAERAKLTPFVAVSVALSDDDDTAYEGSKNQLVAGTALTVSF